MRKITTVEFANSIRPLVEEKFPAAATDPLFLERALLIQERILFFSEAPDMLSYFYERPVVSMDLIANPKQKITAEEAPKIIATIQTSLSTLSEKEWTREKIVEALDAVIAASGLKKGQILWPLRALLTGRDYSPGAYEVALLLGREETLRRLQV